MEHDGTRHMALKVPHSRVPVIASLDIRISMVYYMLFATGGTRCHLPHRCCSTSSRTGLGLIEDFEDVLIEIGCFDVLLFGAIFSQKTRSEPQMVIGFFGIKHDSRTV